MKKLELGINTSDRVRNGTERDAETNQKIQLLKITPKFEEKKDEMGLYLINFERRAEMAGVPKENWVPYLLSVLPPEISNMMARESPEQAKDYDYVKEIILRRYKMNAEKLKQMFYRHPKLPDKSWRNYAHELCSYYDEWIADLRITTFEGLRDLHVTEQMKRRVPAEVKEHFLEQWMQINTPLELAEKIDQYESLKDSFRTREFPKNQKFKDNFKKSFSNNHKIKEEAKQSKDCKKETATEQTKEKIFEKRKQLRCYECGSYDHFRPQCPKLKNQEVIAAIETSGESMRGVMTPYISQGVVNGIATSILRDTGASIDLVCKNFVQPHMYTGEHAWIGSPLLDSPVCLPIAEIDLECEWGHVITKAAVSDAFFEQKHYLLGNKTAALLDDMKINKDVETQVINAVQTRAEKRKSESGESSGRKSITETGEAISGTEAVDEITAEESENILPLRETETVFPDLLKTSPEEFRKAQSEDDELKLYFSMAEKKPPEKSKYIVVNRMLFFKKKDNDGTVRNLLIVPKKYREQLKKLCHEGTSAHLGTAKTKDALFKNFYWPNCYLDVESYVKACDGCQRVGKPNDKRKAPLKLVPVIPEIFTRINVDACGPLPVTPTGKRYLITALCMSSKYPDAIPVTDISSTSVIDALLQIFSRMGFPRELQCDQGTSFVSALTTEFLQRFGITVIHSSVRHPQSNPVERFHRTLKRILKVLCIESSSDWEKNLPPALFALRTATHDSTGFSPAELVHGRNLRTPMTIIYENLVEFEGKESSVVEYVFDLLNRMKKSQELAVEHMKASKIKQKEWYDRKAVKREFKKDDLVLIIAPSRPNKLSVQWIGPGKIESRLSETNYIVSLPMNGKSHVYHVNMLKPYHRRPESINLLSVEETDPEVENDFIKLGSDSDVPVISNMIEESQLTAKLEEKQLRELNDLLSNYSSVFSNEPGMTDLVRHDIELISEEPILAKPYRMSPRQTEILKAEVNKMLRLKVIKEGDSDFTSPLILVETPGKEPRPCIDYRRLNKITKTQYYPLPNIEDRVEVVSAARYISVLDLTRGYWQIPLTERAQRYASFVTSFGSYIPLRMPFGLKNAPYYFSRMMAEILRDCENFSVPYLDDIAVFSQTWEEHLYHLDCVLKRVQKAQLRIKPTKCKFAQSCVMYLGHLVGQGKRTPGELKIQAITNFPQPTTKTEVRAFLGLAGYYRKYIPNFSVISAPLTDLLRGKSRKGSVIWNEDCQEAFTELKKRLSEKPVLYAPDFSRQFILQCDASNQGIGIVLSQINEKNEEHPILFLSRKFSNVEKRYSTTEKECAAIIFAVKRLQYYLDGSSKFVIQTDHNPLVWLHQNTGTNSRLLRWALSLQHLNYEVSHKKGKEHLNADGLSRAPD